MDFDTFNDAYVTKLRAGDEATEAHFVRYFGELLDLKLRSRVRSKEIADDLKQESFARVLKLLRSDGGIRNPERLGPLVNSVCNHVLSEQYRSSKRMEPLADEDASRIPSAGQDALSGLISKDARRVVRSVLDRLSARDRKMLRAVFFEEIDKDEVCREMGVNRQYLRVLLHRAKNSFRDQYAKEAELTEVGSGRRR